MKQELLIDRTVGECRTALLEDGEVVEINIDRAAHRSKIGDIFVGRVESVEKALQAAFVTLPDGLPGYLSLHEASALLADGVKALPPIERLVAKGQWVIVEATRDTIGDKGPRLTSQITLAGRLLAYRPFKEGITVSARIGDESERERLRKTAKAATAHILNGGFILRTLADGADESALKEEADALYAEWQTVAAKAQDPSKPVCIYSDLEPVERALRDWASPATDRILVDGHALYAQARAYLKAQAPDMEDRLEVHTGPELLFEDFGVEAAIEAALDSRVALPGGGWMTVEHTEALSAIDVNSGANMAEPDQEHTALSTNLAAVEPIMRHLRLRDIGGMILIDFIHMEQAESRRKVQRAMEDALKRDRTPGQIMGWSRLELFEMTRKRTRKPLDDFLAAPANPYGTRRIKNTQSIGYDIMRRVPVEAARTPGGTVIVEAAKAVIEWLENGQIGPLGETLGLRISLKERQLGAPDEYEIYVER